MTRRERERPHLVVLLAVLLVVLAARRIMG